MLSFVVYKRSKDYMFVYDLASEAEKNRLVEIKYYQEHPEDEDVWIKRYPENTVHSADIEPDDIFHLQTFKSFYNLPQKAENITFYFDK